MRKSETEYGFQSEHHSMNNQNNQSTSSLAQTEYEAYQRRVNDDLKGIDFDKLAELVEISRQRTESAKERELILLVGRTGAGKSTLLNYLMGSRLKKVKEGLKRYLVVDEGQREYALIGHDEKSKTLHPQVIPMVEINELAYCDCPGFSDNRTREEGLCSSIGLPMAIVGAKAIRAMIVVIDCGDLTVTKGEGFSSLAKTLGGLMKDPQMLEQSEISSNVFYVFTKVLPDDGVSDILKTVNTRQKFLMNEMQDLVNGESQRVAAKLAQLLGVAEAYSRAGSPEEREKILSKALEEINKNQNSDMVERIRDLVDRKGIIEDKLKALIIQLSVCNSILNKSNNVFIIRGDEKDDKQRFLEGIKNLHQEKLPAIPKEHFAIDGRKGSEWGSLVSVMQKIAEQGSKLLDKQDTYPLERASIKKYKKLAETQRVKQETLLQEFRSSSKLTSEKLNQGRKEVLGIARELVAYLDQDLEKKKNQKEKLENELRDLDRVEPMRYKHQNLEPVVFYLNQGRDNVVFECVFYVSLLPALILQLAALPIMAGSIVVLATAPAFGISDKRQEQIADGPAAFLTLLLDGMVTLPRLVTHDFQYQGLPFLSVETKVNPESFDDPVSDTTGDRSVFDGMLADMSPRWMTAMGFDKEKEINNQVLGRYEVTFRARRGKYTGPVTIWIELFVEKRIHPEVRPQIDKIKLELERLETVMSGYLKHDLEHLKQGLIDDEAILQAATKGQLKTVLIGILEKKLLQYESRMQVLEGCRLGYESSMREIRRELFRQQGRYSMIKQLSDVIGANMFVRNFITRSDAYFNQPTIEHMNTVWGRRKTPNQQPNYTVAGPKQGGSEPGARFKLSDKLSSAGWLGKISYKQLPPIATTPLAPFSRARRGSALAAVLEKIAADFYDYLSDGAYWVAKTRLAELPIVNEFTQNHPLIPSILEEINRERNPKIENSVYVMSKYIEGYKDLAALEICKLGSEKLSFNQCLERGQLPEMVIIENTEIPLKGVMEIVAISRLLADPDVLGNSATNTGFIIERDDGGKPILARAVKIDPGYSFNFTGPENLFHQSRHPDTPNTNLLKQDSRNVQYGTTAKPLLWENLTENQRNQFISALEFGLENMKNIEDVLQRFVSRKDFLQTPKQLPLQKVEAYFSDLKNNLIHQEKAYQQELDALRKVSKNNGRH